MLVRVYTDGACSKNPGPGGWAMVFNFFDKVLADVGREKETTNNRMELTAVMKALQKMEQISKHRNYDYELYSDSAYVVNSINNCWLNKWKLNGWKTTTGSDIKNKDLWLNVNKSLRNLQHKNINLKIIKIKGHAGHTFNELVDKLAREQSLMAGGN